MLRTAYHPSHGTTTGSAQYPLPLALFRVFELESCDYAGSRTAREAAGGWPNSVSFVAAHR